MKISIITYGAGASRAVRIVGNRRSQQMAVSGRLQTHQQHCKQQTGWAFHSSMGWGCTERWGTPTAVGFLFCSVAAQRRNLWRAQLPLQQHLDPPHATMAMESGSSWGFLPVLPVLKRPKGTPGALQEQGGSGWAARRHSPAPRMEDLQLLFHFHPFFPSVPLCLYFLYSDPHLHLAIFAWHL